MLLGWESLVKMFELWVMLEKSSGRARSAS